MIALVKITSHEKTYKPGETLGDEFTSEDISRLKRLKVVEGAVDSIDSEDALFGDGELVFLTEKELNKLAKAKLIEYAKSIGLDDLTIAPSKEELVVAILNYIEELEDKTE